MRHDCGADIPAGTLICLFCGLEVVMAGPRVETRETREPGATPTPAPALVDAVAESAHVDCCECGRPLATGVAACIFCGTPAPADSAVRVGDGAVDRRMPTVRVVLPGGFSAQIKGQMMLGRLSPDSNVAKALDFDGVSRRHALLRINESRLLLSDLGSMNGTWLDDIRVDTEQSLSAGTSVIRLGAHVEITVIVEGAFR